MSAAPQAQAQALFVYHRPSGAYLYNAALQPGPAAAQQYRYVGWLLAQALANRAPLGCALAPLLLQKLLQADLFVVSRMAAGPLRSEISA